MPALTDPLKLRDIPLFHGLSDDELHTVNQRLNKRSFPAGTNIIAVETPGDVVYVILSGTLKIKVDQSDSTEVIIALLGAGEVVGELSVVDQTSRSADVLIQEDSTLLWMDRQSFDDLLSTIPAVVRNLLRVLSRRVRLSTEQIQALCTLDVYGRVARQLIAFADLYGVKSETGTLIPMRLTQSDIAGLVGASRERVNQVFVALRNRKLVSVDAAYRVTLLNVPKLREIVQQR